MATIASTSRKPRLSGARILRGANRVFAVESRASLSRNPSNCVPRITNYAVDAPGLRGREQRRHRPAVFDFTAGAQCDSKRSVAPLAPARTRRDRRLALAAL